MVAALSQNPVLARLLATRGLVRGATLAVVQIGDGKTPASPLAVLKPATRLQIQGPATGRIDPASYARWDAATSALTSVDPIHAAQLYVNGHPAVADGLKVPAPFAATGELHIGNAQAHSEPANFWKGTIADVGVYDQALDEEQIGDLVSLTAPPGATLDAPPAAVANHCPFPWGGKCLGPIPAGTYTTTTFQPSITYTVPDGLRSGVYAVRLRAGDVEDMIPFFVRPPRGRSTADACVLMPTFTYIVYANIARGVTDDEYRARVAAWGARPWTTDEHQDYGLSTYNYHHDGSGICHSSRLRPILNLRSSFLAYVDPRGSGVRHLPADLYLLDWLEQLGHRVAFAENGRQALDLLRGRPVDLVLLDIEMPEMNGYETLEALRADASLRDIPVVMMSSVDEVDSVARCVEMGAEDYLFKPVNVVLLRARVAASLEKKRLRDQQRELFRKFATTEVAEELLTTGFALGGKYVDATVMFSDIRSFTRLVESRGPAETIELLNAFYTLMFDAIGSQGGIVNQMVGDGLMALFGAPLPRTDHALRAVRAAVEDVAVLVAIELVVALVAEDHVLARATIDLVGAVQGADGVVAPLGVDQIGT